MSGVDDSSKLLACARSKFADLPFHRADSLISKLGALPAIFVHNKWEVCVICGNARQKCANSTAAECLCHLWLSVRRSLTRIFICSWCSYLQHIWYISSNHCLNTNYSKISLLCSWMGTCIMYALSDVQINWQWLTRGYKLTSQKKIQMVILIQTHMQKRVFFKRFLYWKTVIIIFIFCEQAAKELIFTCRHGGLAATKAFSNLARLRASFFIRPQFSVNALMTMSARTTSVTERPSATFTSSSRTTWKRLKLYEQETRHGPHVWHHYRWQLHPWKVLAPQFHYLWSACTTFLWFCAFTLQKMT